VQKARSPCETAGGVLSVGVSSPLGALRAAAQVGRSD
jgi:hypothetical protein